MAVKANLLSLPVNFAVVQLPERKYPGVVVQGDTLHSMLQQIKQMENLLKSRGLDDLADELQDVKEQLSEALRHLEKICLEQGIPLPY